MKMVEEFSNKLKQVIDKDNIKIYSSPLLRAEQTALIISDVLDYFKNIIFDDRLKEVYMGNFDERPVNEFKYNIYDLSHFSEYGGESYDDVNNRLNSFLNEIDNSKINIIVSHALPLRQMNKILTGNEDKIKVSNYIIIN